MSDRKNFARVYFDKAFEAAQKIVSLEDHHNGTGYFDSSQSAEFDLEAGQIARATTNDRRKAVIIGSPLGNVVIFERYSDGGSDIFVCHLHDTVRQMTDINGALTVDQMSMLTGMAGTPNIGKLLGRLEQRFIYSHEKRARANMFVAD